MTVPPAEYWRDANQVFGFTRSTWLNSIFELLCIGAVGKEDQN
jgi:hypothetical protein